MLLSEPPCSQIYSRRPRLLLVDDDPSVVRGLSRILRRCRPDFEVNAVKSPARAVQALSERHYHVVITDLQMPGGGGRAVLQVLNGLYPETARVVHSSQLEASETFDLSRLAHVVLGKPATEAQLLAAIDLSLARVAQERSLSRVG